MKRIMSMLLVLALLVSPLSSALRVHAAETMPLSVTASAGEGNTVIVTVAANQDFDFGVLVANVTYNNTVFTRNGKGTFNSEYDMGYDAETDGFMMAAKNVEVEPFMDNVASGTTLATYEFTYDDTATGEFEFGLVLSKLENGDYESIIPAVTTASVKYTIAAAPTDPTAYTAKLTGENVNVHVGDSFEVYLGADKDFAATEMTITYDSSLVTFNEAASDLGSAAIDAETVGTLKLADYGADKTAGNDIYTLAFDATAEGDAKFNITKAGFGTGTSAENKNLFEATLPAELTVPITVETHTVTLNKVDGKDIFDKTGEQIVEDGASFTFKPETSTGAFYNYNTITVTMGEATVTANRNDDGTYTISNPDVLSYTDGAWTIAAVTDNVTITGTRTAKTYRVTSEYSGYTPANDDEKVTLPDGVVPTYGVDYTFWIPENREATQTEDGYTYSATVTVNGSNVSVEANVNEYTIVGTAITGDIVITVSRETNPALGVPTVDVAIDGSTDVTFKDHTGTEITVPEGDAVTLVLDKKDGYTYTVEVNDEDVTGEFKNGEYTFNPTEDTTVVVTKNVDTTYVEVAEYVTMKNSQGMWLVMISHDATNAQLAGNTYTYDGNDMFWSSKYNAYCYLVIAAEKPAKENMVFTIKPVETIPEINYNNDVNGSENATVDANDAQLVYNMYNTNYEDFTSTVTMEKFFKADIVAGATEGTTTYLGTPDAAAIISAILG